MRVEGSVRWITSRRSLCFVVLGLAVGLALRSIVPAFLPLLLHCIPCHPPVRPPAAAALLPLLPLLLQPVAPAPGHAAAWSPRERGHPAGRPGSRHAAGRQQGGHRRLCRWDTLSPQEEGRKQERCLCAGPPAVPRPAGLVGCWLGSAGPSHVWCRAGLLHSPGSAAFCTALLLTAPSRGPPRHPTTLNPLPRAAPQLCPAGLPEASEELPAAAARQCAAACDAYATALRQVLLRPDPFCLAARLPTRTLLHLARLLRLACRRASLAAGVVAGCHVCHPGCWPGGRLPCVPRLSAFLALRPALAPPSSPHPTPPSPPAGDPSPQAPRHGRRRATAMDGRA